MGKKPATKAKVKVGPPKQSKKKSSKSKPKTLPQPTQPPKPNDSATATVQRVFGGAKNKFLAQRQQGPEAAASTAGASTSTLPNTNYNLAADSSILPPNADNADEDGSASDDSASESADLSDVDGNTFSQVASASASESESDTEESTAIQPLAPESKLAGKGKEKEGNGQSSKALKETATPKPSKGSKLARFGQLVFVPIVPMILSGNKLPTLPLPTPHEIRSLRAANLGAVPPSGQSTFGIDGNAASDKVDRYFRKILPKPFKAMGKNAGYHLMYSHGSTLGGCGTASPNGFDIATAYRAGKANSQKVLYIAPAKSIPDEKIKLWELDAVVGAIKRRLQTKKRKRSAGDGSSSEDGSDESDWASEPEDGTEPGLDVASISGKDTAAIDPADIELVEEELEPEVTRAAPPRKKLRITSNQSSSAIPDYATSTNTLEPTGSSRVLRERNRPSTSSNSVAKAIDPLNPWLNASNYTL